MRGAYDRADAPLWRIGQWDPVQGLLGVGPAGPWESSANQRLRIFSTMAVVELFSTRPSTRTSPP